ncbi:MAG: SHOCT domain-containing protein [Caldilineaceae bacterium]
MQTSLFLLATDLQNGPVGQAMQRGDFGRGGRGHGFGFFPFFPLLTLIALALLAFWIWRNWNGRNNFVEATANALHGGADRFKSAFTSTETSAQSPLQVLQTRYASGEISRDEYLAIRQDLVGGSAADAPASASAAEAADEAASDVAANAPDDAESADSK